MTERNEVERSEHKTYPKILQLHNEACEWMLNWQVFVQSKLDWANLSIRMDEWWISIGSRTQIVYSNWTLHKKFNNVQNVILNHWWIIALLKDNPNYRLYWEFLVKHTISYPDYAYNKFYMFDIYDHNAEAWIDPLHVMEIAIRYSIDYPTPISIGYQHFTLQRLNELMMESKDFWVMWEWIVIKPWDFTNKFGDRQYGKLVKPEFKEENSIVFGNVNKTSPEDEFSSRYITEARVLKMVNKVEQNEDRNIKIEDTPRIIWMTYHDAFEEELRWFAKKRLIDFRQLESKCSKRTRYLFHRYLNWWSDLNPILS